MMEYPSEKAMLIAFLKLLLTAGVVGLLRHFIAGLLAGSRLTPV